VFDILSEIPQANQENDWQKEPGPDRESIVQAYLKIRQKLEQPSKEKAS
jgi:hypothetical protein